ncbi:DUF5134 domain-containing protein [Cryobacterium sp. PH29-G1]|uniref:DUF5134 domain-containing protein n=1 Tax=Cryobacterium sp. PH29-G1 TaxID=3046211 RepID=UPI0024BBD846|nr:DUF5134 domain-containing protein [Cryobacterium sp. PH29-G1]MDJ0348120.1 DUF5134 domain-containing protein [Cryobacterium sp. PH29-G1]
MFDLPALTWTLTAVLLLSGCYYVVQAIRSRQITSRVNNGLSALMNVVMASMMWHLGATTMLAQIAVLTVAALWFLLQAVARPELKILCASSHGRLKCAYHTFAMASAAVMVALMMGHLTTAGSSGLAAGTMSMSGGHHSMAATPQSAGTAALDHSPDLATVLALTFGAAAIVFLVLLVRWQVTKSAPRIAAPHNSVRADHGFEAVGAAVMAIMFAAM